VTVPGGGSDEIPEVGDADDPDLEGRLAELEKELQYANAEVANARQRAVRDRSEAIRYGSASLARRLLPMVDSLSKAVDSAEGDNGAETVIEGVRMTLDGIRTALEAEGVSPIEAAGKPFDPTCMEAIATVPGPEGSQPGSVIEVIEQGFTFHDRVLRAARVVVAEDDT
jgi:molecular chaperone GrpE|tara:strand:- start:60885 stop:61391 length:507 start_codon:yes stop_codon:yes gene_type:complete